ncbi:hypothetical protein A3Q56_07392, partial [Intoshia linei]
MKNQLLKSLKHLRGLYTRWPEISTLSDVDLKKSVLHKLIKKLENEVEKSNPQNSFIYIFYKNANGSLSDKWYFTLCTAMGIIGAVCICPIANRYG